MYKIPQIGESIISIYTLMTSMGIDPMTDLPEDVQEGQQYGTFDAAMRACCEFWNTSDSIHPDICTWVESTKDDTKHYPEDYYETHLVQP